MDEQFTQPAASPNNQGTDVLGTVVGIYQPRKRERFEQDKGWHVYEEFVCHRDNRDALTPAIGSAHAERVHSFLRVVIPEQYEETPLYLVRLEYLPDPTLLDGADIPGGTPTCPANTISEDGATVEQDIRLHPAFEATLSQYWDWQNSKFHDEPHLINPYTGIESYLVGSLLVTEVTYTDAEPAGVEGDLGTLVDPWDRASGVGLSQYLIVAGTKSKEGSCWVRTIAYQYNQHGWDTTIYS